MRCDVDGCVVACDGSGRYDPMYMHVTCARQAGFEVRLDDKSEVYFYGMWGTMSLNNLGSVTLSHVPLFYSQFDATVTGTMSITSEQDSKTSLKSKRGGPERTSQDLTVQ